MSCVWPLQNKRKYDDDDDDITFRYVGELNRDEATRMLSSMPNGTFLIRVSNTASRRGEHALSIRFDLFAYLFIFIFTIVIS